MISITRALPAGDDLVAAVVDDLDAAAVGAAAGVDAVAAGVGHTAPVHAVAAGGGVIADADGNSLIDLGSGIAVTTIGNAHPKVVAAVQSQVAQFTHTCFMIAPHDSYVSVAEALNRITPGDHV